MVLELKLFGSKFTFPANENFRLLIILLAGSFAFALCYLIFQMIRRNFRKGFTLFIFMLAFPVIAPVIILAAALVNAAIYKIGKTEYDPSDLSFSKERVRVLANADIEQSMNTVPLEEALLFENHKDKRKSLIDVLKTPDYEKMYPQIREAVNDSDMEVSHYAAAFISDTKKKYKEQELKLRIAIANNPTVKNYTAYFDYMGKVLEKDAFSLVELRNYAEYYDAFAHDLLEIAPDTLSSHTVIMLVYLWEKVGFPDRSREWIRWAESHDEESLECFKLCAKCYFREGKRDKFMDLLARAKKSGIAFDNEALQWIRFFREEEESA